MTSIASAMEVIAFYALLGWIAWLLFKDSTK